MAKISISLTELANPTRAALSLSELILRLQLLILNAKTHFECV